jgi:putative (di)nucleoside polyphosphate hydrolase|tara:strand:- start:2131 stop:2595 length:465 start_codon:yes stop_codon:yes gene_type:complete
MDFKDYRRGVGMVVINHEKKIFIGQRFDKDKAAWQMPQGGIDNDETPEQACLRELGEETGILSNYKIIDKTKNWYSYDLPRNLQKKLWRGKYKGQVQQWFILDFFGNDAEINIKTKHPEFKNWKWANKEELMKLVVPFKRELYENTFIEFSKFL